MKDDHKTKKQLIDELTELRSQNAELKKSESSEKYRSLVENIREVIYELDDQGVVLYISPAIRDMLGFDSAEIVGKKFIELAHKDDQRSLSEWFYELRKGVESPSEYRVTNKSCELRWARTKSRPIIEDSLFKGARGILIDITSQKLMEEALRKSEEKYRWVLDNMADVITVMDMNLRFTYVSPSIIRMRGYTAEEAVMQTFEQVMTSESLKISAKVFEEEMKLEASGTEDPNRIRIVEVEQYRRDGSIVLMENHLSFLRDEAKKAVGIISVSHDITERKRAEKQLKQTLESLRKAFGATIQVMVSSVEIRDPYTAGHQIRSSDLARAIAIEMGLPQEKIEGIRMAGSIHDIGKLSVPAEILSKPGKLSEIEFSLVKEHSRKGYEMLKDVESPWPLAQIVYQHHERMDGSGYPRNLKGDEILLEARIMAVADVVESMASHRPYRPALGIEVALMEIEKNKGILYDNAVADACLRLFREKGFQLKRA